MSRRKPRRLSAEEETLWRKVTAQAKPLAKSRPLPEEPPQELPPSPGSAGFTPQAFRLGERAVPKPRAAATAVAAPAMDRKAHARLKRGRLRPEARIDLHGMTLAEAHPRLTGFIMRAHEQGKRLVLVITGKGRTGRDEGGPIPTHPGVLRRHVPDWLLSPPLGALVLEVTPAHLRHGGEGAFYVYLRRAR